MKRVRSQSAWRVVLGRLGVLLELIPQHGLAKANDHGAMTLEAVMEFTSKAFESPNGDVRSTAVKVTLECCALAGRGLYSSTFRLNFSATCGIGGAFRGGLGVV